MARTPDEPINGQMGSYNENDTAGDLEANTIQATGQDVIDLPSSGFVADADITRDGQDLVLEAPDGSVIIIEGYFSAEPAPVLLSPEGQALTPQLVQSFVTQSGPTQYANTATLNDESPVGAVQEMTGKATVTRTDGTTQEITIGTPIYQGDIIETNDEGAVNIVFVDETSFAVSENARLAIDEYVYDPATESGSQGFSILRGVFVFTSGLIGRDDPDDVNIDTPVGSIGIRGTTIMGHINPNGDSQITIVEGAIVVRNSTGEQTLATEFETITLSSYSSTMTNQGSLDSGAVNDSYGSLRTVSPDAFLAAEDTAGTDSESTSDTADSTAGTEDAATEETATEEASATENEETQTTESSTAATEETTESTDTTESTETADSTDGTTDTSDSTSLSLDTDTSFDGTDSTFDSSTTDDGSTSGSGDTTTSTSGGTSSGDGSTLTSTTDDGSTSTTDDSGSTLPPLDIVISRTEIDNDLDTATADTVALVGTTYNFSDVTFQLLDAQINGVSTGDFTLVDGPDNKAAIKLAVNGPNIFDSGDTLTFSVQATLPDGRTTTETYNVAVSELVGLGNIQITDFIAGSEGANTIQENSAGEVAFDALAPIFGDDNPATEPVTWNLGSVTDNSGADFSALFEIVAHPSGDTNQARIQLKAGQSLDAEAIDGQLTFTVLSQLNATGELATQTVTMNIADFDDTAPTLDINAGVTVNEGAATVLDASMLDASDVDTADTGIQFQISTLPANGNLQIWTGSVWANAGTSDTFTMQDINAGNIRYAHNDSETTADSFDFMLKDSAGNTSGTYTFNIAVNPVNDAPTGGVTVTSTGTIAENETLAADTSSLADNDGLGTFSYQWESSNDGGTTWTNIGGATGATYLLDDPDVGNNIRVKVSYTDGGGTLENVTSGQTTAVTNVNDAPTGGVTITGTAAEDQTLTADTSSLADADGLGTYNYQWEISNDGGTTWTNIGGATGATYTLGDADVGNNIRVKVSYTDGGGTTENVTSGQTTAVTNVNDAPTGGVTITGTATEDQTLTADTSGISDADGLGTYTYQWESSDDGGATWTAVGTNSQNYVLNDGDVGQEIRVTVSYTDGNGTAESLTSTATAPVTNVNDAPTGSVTITGTEQEGSVLTADTSAIVDDDGLTTATYSYQWEMSSDSGATWTIISGAINNTFTPGNAEAGNILRVKVSYTDDNGTAENITSGATGAITAVDDAPTLAVNDGIADALNFEEGDGIVIDTTMLSTSDPDTAATDIVYTLSTLPLYGDLYLSGTLLNSGGTFTQQDLINGNLVFRHDGTANSDGTTGTADDAFQFDVTDGTTTLTANTFEIDVAPASVPQLHALASRPDDGFVISGATGSQMGAAVAAVGNIDNLDGMGYEDFVIAQPGTGLGDELIATESGTGIGGSNTTFNGTGRMSLSSIGDFDGDGDLDYIAGQADSDSNLGATAIANTGNVQIADTAGLLTEIVSGHNAGDQAGYSVAGIGDINGDGLSDIIYGAPGDDDTGTDAGAAYVFYGTGTPTNLDPANTGFSVTGAAGDRTGSSVSSMGDFNNDGYTDFMVGSTGAGGGNTGKVELYWGGAAGPTSWTSIPNIGVNDPTDVPIFHMGDMNGDGISDIAYADTLSNTMHFLFGGTTPDTTVDFAVTASAVENLYIDSGGSIGDFNGDGFDDAVFAVRSTTDSVAEIFVLYGHAGLTGNIELTQAYMDDPSKGFVMDYDLSFLASASAPFNFVFSSAGDVDGDGFEDLLIGTPDANSGDGEALVVYGRDDDAVAADGNQMHIAYQTTAGANVIANANDQHLVGFDDANNLNDGGFANISMQGGAGNDLLEIHDLGISVRSSANLGNLDGGTGYDTLKFFGANDTLDFVGVGSEGLSGIDEFQLMEGGQTLKLGLDDVFRLLQESENNSLKITDISGGTTNLVINDNDGTAENTGLNTDMANQGFTDGGIIGTYQVWNFGNYQLLIDTNIDSQTIA